jgi:hypothetical protein
VRAAVLAAQRFQFEIKSTQLVGMYAACHTPLLVVRFKRRFDPDPLLSLGLLL